MRRYDIIIVISMLLASFLCGDDFVGRCLGVRERLKVRLSEYRQAESKESNADKRRDLLHSYLGSRRGILVELLKSHPVETDWLLQDLDIWGWAEDAKGEDRLKNALIRCGKELGVEADVSGDETALLRRYLEYCARRRVQRLSSIPVEYRRLAYIKRAAVVPSFFAYTEGQSDAQHERFFRPGSELTLLTIGDDCEVAETSLLRDEGGMLRDPDVHFDGNRLLFSWKKSDRQDDYHLYEMDLKSRKVRQITYGLGCADYEGIYTPGDQIVFSSTRCVQTVDCWWTEVSNLYACDMHGNYLRRLGFDQVHTIYPQLMNDGGIVYTRWDYNDRGQIFTQSLFRMNPDGTGQTEYYGNNSWFPTTSCHARPIPGSQKVLAVAMGHHTWQAGKLILIDVTRGRQEADGVEFVAPRRPAEPVRIDSYGQEGELFRHPYPISEDMYYVSYTPKEFNLQRRDFNFGLYYMDSSGCRELLNWNSWRSCNHPVVVKSRVEPTQRPSVVDYRQSSGFFYLHDVYKGPGLAGIARGEAKQLRVVALDFRAAGIGLNGNGGPAGGAGVCTPVAIGDGCWDAKIVLGTTPIQPDGSAFFKVPARTPVYFQVLDKHGHSIQTMRSWSTLQPNEVFSCIGCHEHKNESVPTDVARTEALVKGPLELEPFLGKKPAGFSYIKQVQPIWDKHCLKCHEEAKHTFKRPTVTVSYCCPADTPIALIDGVFPKHSRDESIRRFTWYPQMKGSRQWVQLTFERPLSLNRSRVYWYTEEPHSGVSRPVDWSLSYLPVGSEEWKPVPAKDPYGLDLDKFVEVRFTEAVMCRALRLDATMRQDKSAGLLEWQVAEDGGEYSNPNNQVILNGKSLYADVNSKRYWSNSYLSLVARRSPGRHRFISWVWPQSTPEVQEPCKVGAVASKLIPFLRDDHHGGVKLNQEELDIVATWIDLGIPFCGDYREANAWSEAEHRKYDHFEQKRFRQEALERRHLEELIRDSTGEEFFIPGSTNYAVNPYASTRPDSYPKVTSSAGTGSAACVIDGRIENRGEGLYFPAWSPESEASGWIKIDFGREVELEVLKLWLRQGEKNKTNWTGCQVEFSGGNGVEFVLKPGSSDVQELRFPRRRCRWVKLSGFKGNSEAVGVGGITELEAW